MAIFDGGSCHSFGYLQLDHHQGLFIVMSPVRILADLDAVGHYVKAHNAGSDPVLSTFELPPSPEVG